MDWFENVLACPKCGETFASEEDRLRCKGCDGVFPLTDGIPELYCDTDWAPGRPDVTDDVRRFYEESPFPNYEDFDSVERLVQKARKGRFARMLDEQVPAGARVLECGAGTSQLSNFLSIRSRQVVAADLCLNSLRLGAEFARRQGLGNVRFARINLFRPPFRPAAFHLVISNGVLHHTSDPRLGFESIGRLVAPGGFIVVGLYHRYGRWITDLRRVLLRFGGDRLAFLDPNLRNLEQNRSKKQAWLNDQYKHPHESKHTIGEVLGWLEDAGFDFVSSIPTPRLFSPVSADMQLFDAAPPAGRLELALSELLQATGGYREGGFFVVIARRR